MNAIGECNEASASGWGEGSLQTGEVSEYSCHSKVTCPYRHARIYHGMHVANERKSNSDTPRISEVDVGCKVEKCDNRYNARV